MYFSSGRSFVPTLAILLCGASLPLAAGVIQVPATYSSIQAAVNAAANGDVIQVAPGTYFENLNFSGKAITITSTQGPQSTIIDGGSAGPVVTFVSGEGPQSVLSGFTIQHGRAQAASLYSGGGIRISNSSPTIRGNIIRNNDANADGGGIYSSFGSPVIQDNIITNNSQTQGYSGGAGGGIYVGGASAAQIIGNTISNNSEYQGEGGGIALFAAGTPLLKNNIISGNSAYSQGGGIWIVNNSDALIVSNVIAGNNSPSGGGIYWGVPSGSRGPYLVNNTLAGNTGTLGAAIYAGGFQAQAQLINNIVVSTAASSALDCDTTYSPAAPLLLANDVFSSNGPAYAGSCAGAAGLNGNLSVDPLFKGAATGDYHLLTGSPAIDSGTATQAPATDIENVARPLDGNGDGTLSFDMGAYEAPSLDRIPPVTTAVPSPQPNAVGWNKTDVSVALHAADNPGGSGVKQVQYWMTGSAVSVPGSSASVSITAEGTTTLGYNSVDNADNVEAANSLAVKIDKTLPVISGMPAGCTLSPSRHQLVLVATVTASDAVSGVASLNVTATSNQPDSGTGGGDIPGDIVINGGSVQLRAEIAAGSKSRIYTITATSVDNAGNSRTATATCTATK